jgi:hypothetical protein
MGLDIGAFPPGPAKGPPVCFVTFENDGYYWFLHRLFAELRTETGLYLDLYGDAMFGPSHFPRLKKLLDQAGELVEAQPAKWAVHIGTRVQRVPPAEQELFDTVSKVEFRRLLTSFRRVVDEAARLGGYVQCAGD